MSEPYYYLSLFPQALIASMLEPAAFGSYYAAGTRVNSRDEAMFFSVDPDGLDSVFPLQMARRRCVADSQGKPKRSVYLSIHETLAKIPLSALGELHLVTSDGLTLALARTDANGPTEQTLYLYQELCPVTPLVVSRLSPRSFAEAITRPAEPISVPRIVFADLRLGELAHNPALGDAGDLPYANIQHLRDVLGELKDRPDKCSKLYLRRARGGLPFRMIGQGFYVGDREDFAFYPFPNRQALDSDHRIWWRSAQFNVMA